MRAFSEWKGPIPSFPTRGRTISYTVAASLRLKEGQEGEGALVSVVGGLVAAPVIAVPTSVGYGASFGGLAALLAMLNNCAPGVAVVNIDNGFGAGYLAGLINRTSEGER